MNGELGFVTATEHPVGFPYLFLSELNSSAFLLFFSPFFFLLYYISTFVKTIVDIALTLADNLAPHLYHFWFSAYFPVKYLNEPMHHLHPTYSCSSHWQRCMSEHSWEHTQQMKTPWSALVLKETSFLTPSRSLDCCNTSLASQARYGQAHGNQDAGRWTQINHCFLLRAKSFMAPQNTIHTTASTKPQLYGGSQLW